MLTDAPPLAPPDTLADGISYFDDGCSVAPHCLSCPLPECRYAVDGGLRHLRMTLRAAITQARLARGHRPRAIAAELDVSLRTVWRLARLPPSPLEARDTAA